MHAAVLRATLGPARGVPRCFSRGHRDGNRLVGMRASIGWW